MIPRITCLTTLLLLANVGAFLVTPNSIARRPHGLLQVSLSDPSSAANTDVPQEDTEPEVAEVAPVEAEEVTEEESTEEEDSEAKVVPKSTERHTLYVGNLPFCKKTRQFETTLLIALHLFE